MTPRFDFSSAKTVVLTAVYSGLVGGDGLLIMDGEQIYSQTDGFSLAYIYKILDALIGEDKLTYSDEGYSLTESGILAVEQSFEGHGAPIPASDRIVTLSDNQRDVLDQAATDVIVNIERENAIGGDVELKDRLIGQFKAGRELVRAKSLRAWLLYSSLVGALGTLIERYGGTALGEAAKKLLELLIEHVFRT